MYSQIVKEKGKLEVSFQKDILTNVVYLTPNLPVVIAVGTGGGKTTMTIIKLEEFYRNPKNRGKRTLILSSSTKVLRKNFFDSMKEFDPTFTYRSVANRKEFQQAVDDGIEVIIALPQTLNNIKNLPKVEWLVVDEAHKWYFAKTVQQIIQRCKPSYQWLLTGTPFKFNMKNLQSEQYLIEYVSVSKMMDLGRVGNPLVSVVSTDYDIKHSDYYFNTGEIRPVDFGYKTHKNAFTQLVKEMFKMCKNPIKRLTQRDLYQHVFGELDKTIVYCYSKAQARAFHKVCKSLGVNSSISHSENDIDSEKFTSFKTNKDIKVLFVVDRGREGFDMPELFNIVDFTLSTNPEVLLQILGRVLRISLEQPKKVKSYFKVSPSNDVYYHKCIMTGVLQLICDEPYRTFTGKIDKIKIPVPTKPKAKSDNPKGSKNPGPNVDPITHFMDVDIPLSVNWWREISTKHSDLFKSVCWVTLEDVRKAHFGIGKGEWANAELAEVASRFNDIESMVACKEGKTVYEIINKRDIWAEVAPHIQMKKRKGMTYEECKEITSKWTVRPTRKNNASDSDRKVMTRILDRGWLDLVSHIPNRRGQKSNSRNSEEVKREARRRHWMIKKGLTKEQWLIKEQEYQNTKKPNFTLNTK